MSLVDLQLLCLDQFTTSATRKDICAGIEILVADLMQWGVRCNLWIGGGFLVFEPNPEIADVAIIIEQSAFDLLDVSLQNYILTNIEERSYHPSIEVIVVVSRTRDDPDYDNIRSFLDDWCAYNQVTRNGWLKGMAVLRVGETDVGLRLLS
jgi:hypothetical protein